MTDQQYQEHQQQITQASRRIAIATVLAYCIIVCIVLAVCSIALHKSQEARRDNEELQQNLQLFKRQRDIDARRFEIICGMAPATCRVAQQDEDWNKPMEVTR